MISSLPLYLFVVAITLLWCCRIGLGLYNGVALTPPMGWMSWQRFKCETDCKKQPRHCISEALIKRTVLAMVNEGYLAAGYNYVALDDCWLSRQRDKDEKLTPDPTRFPNGMKHLVDFVHSHGLKFGIYGSVGLKTCMKYPGNKGHFAEDARLYAEWGVDMVKFDGCYVPPNHLEVARPDYIMMSNLLMQTGRPIAYLCSWPFYVLTARRAPNWSLVARHCNMWRIADDVTESINSILGIVRTYERLQDDIADLARPGAWNDADQLLIGNEGLSEHECRVQMAMWAIWASPLFMSVDLEEIDPWAKELLKNKRIIDINQDPLGKQGRKLKHLPDIEEEVGIWVKEMSGMSLAIAFLAEQSKEMMEGDAVETEIYFSIFKTYYPLLPSAQQFQLIDVFSGSTLGFFSFEDKFLISRDEAVSVLLLTLNLIPDRRGVNHWSMPTPPPPPNTAPVLQAVLLLGIFFVIVYKVRNVICRALKGR